MLFSILVAVMVVLGIVLIAMILLQQGKGADAGAAFGSGASGTVFGARGSATFLSRATGIVMGLFMVLAVVMVYLGQHGKAQTGSIMQGVTTGAATAAQPLTAPASGAAPAKASTAAPGTAASKAVAPVTSPAPASGATPPEA